jgi:hypothetical protein
MKMSWAAPSASASVDEVGVDRGDRLARAGCGGDGRDLELGVPRQQAQQLPARVAAGPGDRYRYAHPT